MGHQIEVMEDALTRLRAEYLEMPGLRLKARQVQRLCGIDQTICQSVLDALVDAKFLAVKSDGSYARLTSEEVIVGVGPAKSELGRQAIP
jgi:hypothetical protein